MCEVAPENKVLIREEGLQYFARKNYRRAKAQRSRLKRVLGYLTVYSKFNYRYPPPPILKKLAASRRYLQIHSYWRRQ